MLGVKIICVGKLKEKFYIDAADEYVKRLMGYCKLEVIEVPEARTASRGTDEGNNAQVSIALDKERTAIAAKIPSGAFIVAMCIEGQDIDSPGLSYFLSECAGRGHSQVCFIIGGSNGLHDSIKSIANIWLSMSRMTFPHNLARVMLLEQLYRAFNITEGGKYHK